MNVTFDLAARDGMCLIIILHCEDLRSIDLLQIDYSSLVDVRIIKSGNLNKPKAANGGGSEIIRQERNPASAVRPDNNVEIQSSRTGINNIYILVLGL